MEKKEFMISLGNYCKQFRKDRLQLTLEVVSNGDNIKTLSAFEHGNSTNVYHVTKYMNACNSTELKKEFATGLIETFLQRY